MNNSLFGLVGGRVKRGGADSAHVNAQNLQNHATGLGTAEKTRKTVEFIDTVATRENAQAHFETPEFKAYLKALAERQNKIEARQPSRGGQLPVYVPPDGRSHYDPHRQ